MAESERKIQIDVQLTPSDLDELWKNSPIRYGVLPLIGIGLCSFYLAFAYFVNGEPSFLAIEWFLIAVLAFLGGLSVLPIRVRQLFRSSPSLKVRRRYSLSEAGVRFDSDLMTCDCKWEAFPQIRESQKAFVFWHSSFISGLVLPKRCISASTDINEIRDLLNNQSKGKLRLQGRPRT